MVHLTPTTARATRAIIIAAAVILEASAWGSAAAQTSSAPVLDSQRPQMLIPAPVGHRQPRRADLPGAVRRDENTNPEAQSEQQFDQQLQICRGC
jgi:Spy/CpxP family protein refolding chaperone